MSSAEIALVTFLCTFGGALVGMVLHVRLPDHHLDGKSTDVVKLVMGLIATMSALVLGLLIATSQSTYNGQSGNVQSLAANTLEIDRMAQLYGEQTAELRDLLRQTIVAEHDRIWSRSEVDIDKLKSFDARVGNGMILNLANLAPDTEARRFAKSEILQLMSNSAKIRLLMSEQVDNAVPWPFLAILIAWVSMLFMGFGMLARLNATVLTVLFVGAISISGAIFLVMDLGTPYSGLIRLSDAPVVDAIARLTPPTGKTPGR
jgi:hypothetical protein